jgi:hypothetical protein
MKYIHKVRDDNMQVNAMLTLPIFQCIDQKPEVLEYFLKINVYNFRRDKYVRRV